MDKETLIKMTVPKLREEAIKIEGVAGIHGMKKQELLNVLFEHFNIPLEEEKPKKDTSMLKKEIVAMRAKKEEARKAGDKKQVKILQRKIHSLKRQTRV